MKTKYYKTLFLCGCALFITYTLTAQDNKTNCWKIKNETKKNSGMEDKCDPARFKLYKAAAMKQFAGTSKYSLDNMSFVESHVDTVSIVNVIADNDASQRIGALLFNGNNLIGAYNGTSFLRLAPTTYSADIAFGFLMLILIDDEGNYEIQGIDRKGNIITSMDKAQVSELYMNNLVQIKR